jgi:type II secretory pathway pseudopilin PulG
MLGRQRGDTLIEVLFAVTVFSFLVVGALSIMNQGTAASQRSLEINLVRNEIDAQAETLRFMHDAYVSTYQSGVSYNLQDTPTTPAEEWYQMVQHIDDANVTAASDFNVNGTCPQAPSGSFVVDPYNGLFIDAPTLLQPAVTYAQAEYDADGVLTAGSGLWIEAVRSAQTGTTSFIDFHIRACWESAGLGVASSQGTIVRLYEPRG